VNAKPPPFVQIPAKSSCLLGGVDASESVSASSSESSTLRDKRVRHSNRHRSKPQDKSPESFGHFYLGSPSPMRPTEMTEV
jgi:hypothetical protein